MICLTIEWEGKEWFIDNQLEELRLLTDPTTSRPFKTLTVDELAEIEASVEYRATEIEELREAITDLQYPTEAYTGHLQNADKLPAKGAWGGV
jgi:hypothetical protein